MVAVHSCCGAARPAPTNRRRCALAFMMPPPGDPHGLDETLEIARVPSTSSQGGYIEKVKVPCYDLASVGAQQYDFFLDVHRIGSNDLLQV
ncbi:uncharacterized protein LOC110436171 isoform X2 [Sorghum bicolor]|uniref:uncharacterized protein LOC110436171 isoform X2 n=1 Tax=Sorghum bicolor TaxID=4558 RepID=UPI000B423A7C|nr:uncharacterized protein LOC110436171 isoform X2 [Sorghum bicolor]|eukprot:XP_021318199.1 uncharacterized protein LOC110436171 isoform X2 [Sorghum bicolor]